MLVGTATSAFAAELAVTYQRSAGRGDHGVPGHDRAGAAATCRRHRAQRFHIGDTLTVSA